MSDPRPAPQGAQNANSDPRPASRPPALDPRSWLEWKLRWWAVGLVASAFVISLKFVYLPWAASGAVAALADSYGLDVTVGSWSGDLLDLNATAHDVVLEVPGPYSNEKLLAVDEIEVDLSPWARLRTGSWAREVRVRGSRGRAAGGGSRAPAPGRAQPLRQGVSPTAARPPPPA